jgi:hypothetical protein
MKEYERQQLWSLKTQIEFLGDMAKNADHPATAYKLVMKQIINTLTDILQKSEKVSEQEKLRRLRE